MARPQQIYEMMADHPQMTTIQAIVEGGFGAVLRADDRLCLLRLLDFYFVGGVYERDFIAGVVENMEPGQYLTAADEAWYVPVWRRRDVTVSPRVIYGWPAAAGIETVAARDGIAIAAIDGSAMEDVRRTHWADSVFDSYNDSAHYRQAGFGFVARRQEDGRIISVCTSFCVHEGGAEIEVDTDPEFQGRGLARMVAAAFIAECLRRGLRPLWDASNPQSARVAEKLGFVAERRYGSLLAGGTD